MGFHFDDQEVAFAIETWLPQPLDSVYKGLILFQDGSGEEPLSIQTVRRSSMLAAMGTSQDKGDSNAAAAIPVESSEDGEDNRVQ